MPFPQAGTPPPPEESYVVKSKVERDMNIQEIEARNRWKVLENSTPAHDRTALNIKMDMLHDKERPSTFYNHEGRYNEERAGLYKTSYDPHSLAWSMNSERGSAPELMNTLHSHNQTSDLRSLPAARLNEDVNAALKWSRTFSLSQPELSGDRREAQEILHTYNLVKSYQRAELLPPAPHLASTLVQEKELLQKEATTMGDSYNVKKFLQENALDRHARQEPLCLMSSENQSLNRVRSRSTPKSAKSVQFNRSVTVATMSPNSTPPLDVKTQPLSIDDLPQHAPPLESEPRARINPIQYTSTHALYRRENDGDDALSGQAVRHSAPAMFDTSSRRVRFTTDGDDNNSANRDLVGEFAKDRYRSFQKRPGSSHGHGLPDTEYTDQFRNLATNVLPTDLKNSSPFATSYQNQFPVFDLGYKHDARFDWQPGSGVPRPQTSLLKLQDAFVKSEVRKKFHDTFSETNPELRFNISKGKKHQFGGFNAQVIHG